MIQGEHTSHIKNIQHRSSKMYNHGYGGYKEYYRLLFLKTDHLTEGGGAKCKVH